jgi:hypothetical protein
MAFDVLMHKMHDHKHDLESFYWLLVWTFLRHADHDQGPSACSRLFDVEDRELAGAKKEHWLRHSDLQTMGNEPLTQLLEQLRVLFRMHFHCSDLRLVPFRSLACFGYLLSMPSVHTIPHHLTAPYFPDSVISHYLHHGNQTVFIAPTVEHASWFELRLLLSAVRSVHCLANTEVCYSAHILTV